MNLHTATLASGFDRQTCETINLFAARLSQKYHIIMFGYHGLTENSLAHLFWRWTKYMSTANRSAHDLSSPELAFSKAAYLTTLFTSSGICHLARTQTLIPILFPSGTTQKSDQCLGIHLSTVFVPRISLQYSLGVADVPFHMTAVLFWDVIVVLSIFGYRNPGRSRAACWSQSTTTSHARAEYSKRYITSPNPNVLPAAGSRVRGLSGIMTDDS